MRDNLVIYDSVLRQLDKWLPEERITRLRVLALIVTGLYLGASVHLSKVVRKWPVAGRTPSLENRVRRFLDNQAVEVRRYYRPVVAGILQALAGQPIRLILDCTKIGLKYRMLTVSVAYRKRAIPLAWCVYKGSKGHVTVGEQIALLREVQRMLAPRQEVWVLGDSGFQAVELLRWIRRQGWHCVVRLSSVPYVRQAKGPWHSLTDWRLAPGQTIAVGWVRLTQKHDYGWLWLVLHWEQGQDEPWYLVSNQPDTPRTIRRYAVRMLTEEMYGDLKGHGFDLEATHLQDTNRLSRLFLAVALVYTWLLTLGSWVVKRGFRHLVDRKERRDKSFFRIGWDWLERQLALGLPLKLSFVPYP